MRYVIAVLVLVGCAVGQDNNSVMFGPAQPEPQCGKGDASISYYLPGGRELKQGRCYKLEHYKAGCVMAAGMKPPEMGLIEIPCQEAYAGNTTPPEPVDVPAVMKDVESSIIVPKPCPRPVEDGLLGCFDRPTYSVPTCTDKSRIILTAEDGKH